MGEAGGGGGGGWGGSSEVWRLGVGGSLSTFN